MEKKILEIIQKVLNVDNIDSSISQANCPLWDESKHMQIVHEIEKVYKIEFTPYDISRLVDVPCIKAYIVEKTI